MKQKKLRANSPLAELFRDGELCIEEIGVLYQLVNDEPQKHQFGRVSWVKIGYLVGP